MEGISSDIFSHVSAFHSIVFWHSNVFSGQDSCFQLTRKPFTSLGWLFISIRLWSIWDIKKRLSRCFRWALLYLLWQGKSIKWLALQSVWDFQFWFVWDIDGIWLLFLLFSCWMKVELLEGGTFWLSESPSVPGSMSWGAAVPCIATWAISFPILALSILHCLSSKSLFFFFIWTFESVLPCFFDMMSHIPNERDWAPRIFVSNSEYKHGWVQSSCT